MQALTIDTVTVPCKLLPNKRNGLRLSFVENYLLLESPNGKLTQTHLDFIQQKKRWILTNYRKIASHYQQKQVFLEAIESQTILLGNKVEVKAYKGKKFEVHFTNSELKIYISEKQYVELGAKETIHKALRTFAAEFLLKRASELAVKCNAPFNALHVKELRSKWGSASTMRNINLNWHLIMLRPELIDYVIIHELMHLFECNHSKAFWNLVHKHCPYAKLARTQLKMNQWLIGIYD